MFDTGETVGLAEWIIDDTRLVFLVFNFVVRTYLPTPFSNQVSNETKQILPVLWDGQMDS